MFVGTCDGSRHLPYEQSKDLLADQIVRQRKVIVDRQAFLKEITSPTFTDIFISEYQRERNGGKGGYIGRRLTAAEYTMEEHKHESYSSFRITWTKQDGKQGEVKQYDVTSAAALIAYANRNTVREVSDEIKNREDYIVWLQARIDNFKVRDLKPIPQDEQGTKTRTMHFSVPMYGYK